MKLIINKDFKCSKCSSRICCNDDFKSSQEHNFCWNCGEPIEWAEKRTVEEVLDELITTAKLYGVSSNSQDIAMMKHTLLKVDSLKQELLNKLK